MSLRPSRAPTGWAILFRGAALRLPPANFQQPSGLAP
jgi:hypothetical protein